MYKKIDRHVYKDRYMCVCVCVLGLGRMWLGYG